jgi:hypothetical protein
VIKRNFPALYLTLVADLDSLEIEKLSKHEITDFYNTFVSPKSEFRAKVSVHMVAQGQDNAAKMSKEEKIATLVKGITKLLEEEDVPVTESLNTRLEKLDPSTASPTDVASVVESYLLDDVGLDEEEVEELMETGKPMFPSVLVSAGMLKPVESAPTGVVSKIKPVYITDVLNYKSTLQPTSSSVSMVPVETFEELEPKL